MDRLPVRVSDCSHEGAWECYTYDTNPGLSQKGAGALGRKRQGRCRETEVDRKTFYALLKRGRDIEVGESIPQQQNESGE